VNHYWDLITKYFSDEYQSIAYINDEYLSGDETVNCEERALTWIIIALNEDQLLYYCFHSIFKTGTFLANYDENESFLFRDRQELLEISRKIYQNKLYINWETNVTYKEYLHRKLEERI
jgi:hypothetical protein